MKQHPLSFRQIHLDFHTSEKIAKIGSAFDKKAFQQGLKDAHISSVTCFSTCHHGWTYHPTKASKMHPELSFNLLREQMDACHEIGIKVPVYITAGVNNVASYEHPEWRQVGKDGQYLGWTPRTLDPGFHNLCFNSPYLDYLIAIIEEVMDQFPDADGIFTDIISQKQCCCRWCLETMEEHQLDADSEADRMACSEIALEKYYSRVTAAVEKKDPDMPLFHNSGHIFKDKRERLKYFSHIELESLPTGGWGYDHFPLSAKFAESLGNFDIMGMTGKFHTSWGEFGGFKHPNALRYECASMLAFGARCSVGDQLHPDGALNESTYKLIGKAFAEVESKEAWCTNSKNIADIALLSHEGLHGNPPEEFNNMIDTGTSRLLLESHILFDVIHEDRDFADYKALILPDQIAVSDTLKKKLQAYLDQGGKLILSNESALDQETSKFSFDLGLEIDGESPYSPDYIQAASATAPDFCSDPFIVYGKSKRVKKTHGQSLGDIVDPYFNRHHKHFCSHKHTPHKNEVSGFDAAVLTDNTLYFAHPVFSIYYQIGAVAYKEWIRSCFEKLLPGELSLKSNLPSSARIALREQVEKSRYVLHLLYGPAVKRGAPLNMHGGNLAVTGQTVELIEDLPELCDTKIEMHISKKVKSVKSQPDNKDIAFEQNQDTLKINVDRFSCHKMIEIAY